jgi:hypothetical protein
VSFFNRDVAQQALTLITQHMHDCERRGEEAARRDRVLEQKLQSQDERTDEMHRINTQRLDAIQNAARNRYLVLVTSMLMLVLGTATTIIIELLRH